MGKDLTTILIENRVSLQEQMLSSGKQHRALNDGDLAHNSQLNNRLATMVIEILDLLIEQSHLNSHSSISHKLLELTNNKDICLPGLGPALSALRTSVFSLFAREMPIGEWPLFYLHLSSAIDACLLSDSALAAQASHAIETARRLAEAEAQTKREASINWINRAIRGSLELTEIIQSATSELGRTLAVSRLALYRTSSDKLLMLAHEYRDEQSDRVHDLLISTENPLIKQAIETRKPLAIDNVEAEPADAPFAKSLHWVKTRANASACLIHPILIEDRVWGIFYLTQAGPPRRWSQEDIALVEAIADQLIIAIRQGELFAEVARANQEWSTTFDAMSDAVFILDRKKFLRRANRSALKFLDKTSDQMLGKDSADLHLIFRDTQNLLAQAISTGQRRTFEKVYGTPPRALMITADPIVTNEGESLGVVCIIHDVTDLRQVEAEAHTQRQFFASLIENAYDAIFTLDTRGLITWANNRIQNILGYNAAELQGQTIFNLMLEDEIEPARAYFEIAVDGEPQIHEVKFARRDGEVRLAVVTYSPLFVAGQINGVLGIARDITKERQAAEVAAQADKLHALGQMASGVAHDFNNVLATILGRTQLLKRLTEHEQMLRGLDIIETAALDGASTARRIQNFARLNPTSDFFSIDLNQMVRECIEFTSTRWDNDAHARGVNFQVTSNLAHEVNTRGDASELREVFVNLIFNALDAMPKGGDLVVSTDIDEDRAIVRFADTGMGMSEETKRRVFEPFFTTKGNAGTGLGLSVSLSIITHHGGSIEIESEVGKGTAFIVRLPLVKPEVVEKAPSKAAVEPVPPANILLVDDEDSVREVLADMLDIFGHSVVQAATAKAGLAALAEEEFQVVFTDLAMPDMDGWAVAETIRNRNPEIKIVLMTGYGADLGQDNVDKVDAVVSKPFDIEMLRETLAGLLRK